MKPEQRLEQIFRENENKGMAVAITGSWGVGKTFFWNTFRKNNPNKKKYVYVSLFGLESLSDLKTHIYSHIENNSSAIEIPQWIRGLPSILKETKISQFGISSSAKIFDSLMFNQVKDAIICFDDFERMSNKLDIKDVMGLANQLKLERNCQVILILDESKTENENKKKYAEYKEKLIDEEIKITSVEPLLRENAKDIDEPLVNLMVKFADKLEIHNFRFFQKVIKLYKQFLEQLPAQVADTTKEIILVRVLQGYFIEDFGKKSEFGWEDIKLVFEDKQKGWSEQKVNTYESLKSLNYDFVHTDEWLIEFKKYFDQKGDPNFEELRKLANSDLISEENNRLKNEFHRMFEVFWQIQADVKFPNQLFEITKKVIGLDSLGNVSFAITLLEVFGEVEKVRELEEITSEWIKQKIQKNKRLFYNFDSFGEIRPIFKNIIENFDSNTDNLPSLINAVFQIYVKQGWNHEDELSVKCATKQDWERFLFDQVSGDSRFESINSSYIVKKILERENESDFGYKFRSTVKEIYLERGQKSEFYRNYMNYLISRLDN
ncbi:P-loop NTPase fold protein [Acinetobacter sp. TWP2-2-3]|uniref:P-loop NTPase fold protein n=1 Tax=unclassified Acinetobacter TaxID=196816 RepID=UPI003CF2AD32